MNMSRWILATLSLSALISSAALAAPGSITIIEDAQPNSSFDFTFRTSGGSGMPGVFLLDDDSDPTLPNSRSFTVEEGTYTVTQDAASGWNLSSITCSEDDTQDSVVSLGNRRATINVQADEIVVCKFVNTPAPPTAAQVSISGRVLTATGRPIAYAYVTMQNIMNSHETFMGFTNPFGYYLVTGPEAGSYFVVTIQSKSHQFAPVAVHALDNMTGVDFIAAPAPNDPVPMPADVSPSQLNRTPRAILPGARDN